MAGSTKQAGSSLKTKKPQCGNTEASGNEINFEEEIVMSNISTEANNVIPFAFEARSVRVQEVGGAPWFCATDVCSILGYRNAPDAIAKHCRGAGIAKRDISSSGQKRSLAFIDEGNLYRLIIKSRKVEALRFETWVCDEVLPSIRKHGQYIDHHSVMGDLVGAVIGTSGEHVLDRVIDQKASPIPHGLQRSFKHTMKSRLRSRFNVPRTALIPAEYLNDACNFVVAYSLEGEWIGRAGLNTHELTDKELYDVGFLIHHFLAVKGIYERWGVGSALRMLGSPIPAEISDHFSDAMMAIGELKKRSADMDVAAIRLGLRNGKTTRSAAA
ncbi:phage repressor protein [Pseudomonas sp. JL2]|uniref:BRO-N domain-containing protein n=1 Tax=Pseudomonas sp. JL2 TaxID=2919942 RepID=UPI0028584DDF|nr:BRO family protein [Pseudomonas sp. JL2]MDR8383955.1 phage repressor protein [Pseudomonas sp. JL2]